MRLPLLKVITVASLQSVIGVDTHAAERMSSTTPAERSSTSAPISSLLTAHNGFELPEVRVDVKKNLLPTKSDVLTKAALSEYFLKQYPGASFKGQDPTENHSAGPPNYALVMYRDDQRLSQRHSLQRLETIMEVSGDSDGAKALKSEIDRLTIRRPTPLNEAMDRSVNHWRRK